MIVRTRVLVACVLAGLLPRPASPQVPLGSEFRVNAYTTGAQVWPSIASDPIGRFTVVWQSLGQDGSGQGVFGRRYDASGAPSGTEFQVNGHTTSAQAKPRVSADAAGDSVVVWNDFSQDGSQYNPVGRRYDAAGTALEPVEFRVNSYTTSTQQAPVVASSSGGDFVVIWHSFQQRGTGWDLFGQRYDASGMPQGTEFPVSSETGQSHYDFEVAMDGSGNFVAVWGRPNAATGNADIFFQRFDAAGDRLGGETLANSYTTNLQSDPAVAMQPGGGFVVVWFSAGQEGLSNFGIFGRRFDAAGTPIGADFHINDYTTGRQWRPSVAADSAGNFVVVWEGYDHDGQWYGIYGRRFDASGKADGAEFRVNTTTSSSQLYPRVASAADGRFVVVWQAQDGSGYGVSAQRFAPDRIFKDGFDPSAGQRVEEGFR